MLLKNKKLEITAGKFGRSLLAKLAIFLSYLTTYAALRCREQPALRSGSRASLINIC